MDGINNYIYEVQRGTKPMALVTIVKNKRDSAIKKIKNSGLDYAVQELEGKVNIFFGHSPCVKTVRGFLHKKLHELSAEEDFILGTMLGYCRIAQCERYLGRTVREKKLA